MPSRARSGFNAAVDGAALGLAMVAAGFSDLRLTGRKLHTKRMRLGTPDSTSGASRRLPSSFRTDRCLRAGDQQYKYRNSKEDQAMYD
jgi:hypothetical protein